MGTSRLERGRQGWGVARRCGSATRSLPGPAPAGTRRRRTRITRWVLRPNALTTSCCAAPLLPRASCLVQLPQQPAPHGRAAHLLPPACPPLAALPLGRPPQSSGSW
jgi:hypothetical protein